MIITFINALTLWLNHLGTYNRGVNALQYSVAKFSNLWVPNLPLLLSLN